MKRNCYKLIAAIFLLALSSGARAQLISTVAGTGVAGSDATGGPATMQQLYGPTGVSYDIATSRLYIADSFANVIRMVDASGAVTTVAGGGTTGLGDGRPAVQAQLITPTGVSVDGLGNFYIADLGNKRIRKVNSAGIITTVAGIGAPIPAGAYGDGGLAVSAQLNQPYGVKALPTGAVYIIDRGDNVVRTFNTFLPAPTITTIAGIGNPATAGYTMDGGPATAAEFNAPAGIAVVPPPGGTGPDVIYISDRGNHVIRKVTMGIFTVSTIAGTSFPGFSGDGGPATAAQLSSPSGIYWLSNGLGGSLYIVDSGNNRIREITSGNIIQTIAGGASSGSVDGPSLTARFTGPTGIYATGTPSAATLYIADKGSNAIRKITGLATGTPGSGTVTTIAGTKVNGYSADGGPAAQAELNQPVGVAYGPGGNVYIADSANNVVRRITSGGIISTIAGSLAGGFGGDTGPASAAKLSGPSGVSVDASGSNLYIADAANNRIRKIALATGIITTVAGGGTLGLGDGGAAVTAMLNNPTGVKVDAAGNIFIADRDNNRIRKVDAAGTIYTVAGDGTGGYSGDGVAIAEKLYAPSGVTVDATGNIYIADALNNLIRKVDGSGNMTTVVGNYALGLGYGGDGHGATDPLYAQLNYPTGVVVNAAGDIYIADRANHAIRSVILGQLGTYVGTGSFGPGGYNGDPATPTGAIPNLNEPSGLDIDAATGNMYIADRTNNRIRTVISNILNTLGGNGVGGYGGQATSVMLSKPQGVILDAAGNILIADAGNNLVRKIEATNGVIHTIAGTYGSGTTDAGDLGPATAASIPNPTNLAVDAAGNIYITSTGFTSPLSGNRVRMIDAAGIIDTFVGSGALGFKGDNTFPFSTGYTSPEGLAFTSDGDLLVAATGDNKVEWLIGTPSAHTGYFAGKNYSFAGNGTKGYGGLGSYELLNGPTSATSFGGVTYIADRMNHVVRKVDAKGVMSVFAGVAKVSGNGSSGIPNMDALSYPSAVAYYSSILYIADAGNDIIRKVDLATNSMSIYAGTVGVAGPAVDVLSATSATFNNITGLDVDASGNLYVADQNNNVVRKISSVGTHPVTTVAGTGLAGVLGSGGLAIDAQLNQPYSVAADTFGNFYVADRTNNIIRKINAAGVISTYAGTGIAGFSDGPATTCQLSGPTGVALDQFGNLYIVDQGNNRIRMVTPPPGSVMSTIAGSGAAGSTDGLAATASFYVPTGIAVNQTGSIVYVADGNNNKVRKITGGNVSTVAGNAAGTPGYAGDGGAANAAQLDDPKAVCLDKTENFLYIADFQNNVVRMVDLSALPTPTITTVAGMGPGFAGFTGDGVAATTTDLNNPAGVVIDNSGNLYISDFSNNRVRRVNPAGIINTMAGDGTPGYSGDGGDAVKAQLHGNFGITLDTAGSLFIADRDNNVIRKVTAVLLARISTSATFNCQDSCMLFTNNSVGTVDSIRWMVSPAGPGILNSNKDTTTVCFYAGGTYTVSLHIYYGTKDSVANIDVNISATPHPPITRTSALTLEVPISDYRSFQWYNGGSPIAGAVVNSYTATTLGTYSIEVDSNGCKGMSSYTLVSSLGVTKANDIQKNKYWLSQQDRDNSSVIIYAAHPLDDALTVTVYDATGRAVMENKWSKGSRDLQIRAVSLASGMYMIRLTNDNTSETLKWLKN